MSTERVISTADVQSLASCKKLEPVEADFAGRKGYERKYRKDGSYKWRYRFPTNDHGKVTREYAEVGEMLGPSMRAHTARQLTREQGPTVALYDKHGNSHHVHPALADETAVARGWGHRWRPAGGLPVESGVDGELWRQLSNGEREPTGRWCLGTPAAWQTPPPGGNPDGTMGAE